MEFPHPAIASQPQIERMIDTVMQRGLHAILYGERGVGKSSLANTFATKLFGGARTLTCIAVNCHPNDDHSSVWRKVFRRLEVDGQNLAEKYPGPIEPDDVVVEFRNRRAFHVLCFCQRDREKARSVFMNWARIALTCWQICTVDQVKY